MPRKYTKPKTPKPKKPKRGPTAKPFVQVLCRIPPEIKEWLEDTAVANGMSRDAFIRMLFSTARATWNEADDEAQQHMFNELSSHIDNAVRRAVIEAVNNAPSAAVARGLGRPRPKDTNT